MLVSQYIHEEVPVYIYYLGKMNTETGVKGSSKSWEHYLYSVNIKGVSFTYKTGLAHFTPYTKNGVRLNKPLWGFPIADLKGWIHVPYIESVLRSLFSDASLGAESFDDFCLNLGYSDDSITALDLYRLCMDTKKNLIHIFGKEYPRLKDKYLAEHP